MLENWSALEIIAGFVALCVFCAPPLYAWADRWLDRTRNSTKDEVKGDADE